MVVSLLIAGCRAPRWTPTAEREGLRVATDEEGRTPLEQTPSGRSALRFASVQGADVQHGPGLSEVVRPYDPEAIALRPEPLIELGVPFLSSGPIPAGIELPTGAVIQPSLIVFGDLRSALQSFDDGATTRAEWANRLDLYANLQLSGTERVLLGVRPLDDQQGNFTGVAFRTDEDEGWTSDADLDLQSLFFEGELGEMFPGLDPDETGTLDLGLTVGRVPLQVQDGILMDDAVDLVSVTRNSLTLPGVSNLRLSGFVGWNDLNRNGSTEDDAVIGGLLTSADVVHGTVGLDVLYVDGGRGVSSAWYGGLSSVQRLGGLDTTFRVLGSAPTDGESPEVGRGALVFCELAKTRVPGDDVVYLNGFWSPDAFSSAARDADRGGAVGRTGILFEPSGLGNYRAPLGMGTNDSVGGALGYQHFLDGIREQIVLEVGGIDAGGSADRGMLGIGVRYQRAYGRHTVLRLDAFAADGDDVQPSRGVRLEWRLKF